MARASLLAVVSRFSSVFISLLTGIIVARTLGAGGKGALAYLTTATNFAARLTSLGLEASFTRFHRVKGVPADVAAGSVVWTVMVLGSLGAALLNLAVWLLPVLAAAVPPVLVHAYFWAMPPVMFLFVFGVVMYGMNAEGTFGAVDVGMRALMLGVTVAVVGTQWNTLVTVGVLQLAAQVAAAAIGYHYLRRTVGGPLRWRADTVRAMIGDSGGVYAYNTIRYALGYGSMLLAAQLLSVRDAGIFSVAIMLGEGVTLLAGSINLAFYPAVSVAGQPAAYARRVAGMVMLLCAGFGLVILVIGSWIVPRLYGNAFAPAVPLFAATLPGVVLLGGEQVFASFFVAAGFVRPATISVAIGAALLPILSVWLAGAHGIYGLAVACSLAHGITAVLAFAGFWRHSGRFTTRLA